MTEYYGDWQGPETFFQRTAKVYRKDRAKLKTASLSHFSVFMERAKITRVQNWHAGADRPESTLEPLKYA